MGLVHISEIDRNYVKDVHEHLRENDVVQAKVIAIKEDGKIDLSIKALQDPAPTRQRRGRPGLRGPPEEVHAPERGAPGGLQALRRAQAQVGSSPAWASSAEATSGSSPNSSVARQRSTFTVVARCPGGHPLVIRNAPVDERGDPFPTTFWLSCPDAVRAVSQLEAEGWISRLNERLEAEPDFADAVARAHADVRPRASKGRSARRATGRSRRDPEGPEVPPRALRQPPRRRR